jgi:hypothetical protein
MGTRYTDDDNIEQSSYLVGFDAGVRSNGFHLKVVWFLFGMFIGLWYRFVWQWLAN